MTRIFIIMLLIVTLSFFAVQGVQADNFRARTEELMEKYRVPGVAVALIEKGEISLLEGWGYQDQEKRMPVTPETIFQVASISKPVAAVGALRLVQSGAWDLDDPLQDYLKSWNLPDNYHDLRGITLRRVLSHSAGLGPGGYLGYTSAKEKPSLVEALEGSAPGSRAVEIVATPGQEFRYSGGGYTVLEQALEDLTGRDFADYMAEEVLQPLEMKDSTFNWEEKMAGQLALPYSVYNGVLPNYLFAERAAAGLYSTAADLALFLQYALAVFEGAVDPELGVMFTEQAGGYGLGWQITILPDGRHLLGHGGSNRGWKANMALIPEDGAGIIILTNSDRGMPFYRDLTNYWLEKNSAGHAIDTPGRIMMYLIDLYQRFGLWFLR